MADSIREALTSAIAEAETTDDQTVVAEQLRADDAPADTGSEPVQAEAPVTEAPAEGAEAPVGATEGAPAADKPVVAPTPADKAPGSWKPEERAAWAQIPPAAREAIKRREAEAMRAVTAATNSRRFEQEYQKTLHPFEPLLKHFNVQDPLNQVIKPLLQIRGALEVGSPEQKARIIASFVRDFKIDVGMLDGAITESIRNPQAPNPHPMTAQPAASLRTNPELAPLFAIAERMEQATQAKASQAIEAVQDLPHFEDLRGDMADIMEKFAERGKRITIKEAYDRAMALNPEFVPDVATPSTPVSTSEAAAILARSRKAASSVSGAPQSSVGKKPTNLRDQISAAMDHT